MSTIEATDKIAEPGVQAGNVFATCLQEIVSMVRELEARRRFDDDVARWLKEKNCIEEFEAWRHPPSAAG